MKEENLIGQSQAPREDYDLLTPILVCLGSKRYTELRGLLKMLNLVLLDNLSSSEKVKKLAQEFDVEITPHLEKGVDEMCNLSEGVEKRGEHNKAVASARIMIKNGEPKEKIMLYVGLSEEEVDALMQGASA